jgi:hypothetical protein
MRPYNMIGGAPNRGGAMREYKLPSNVAAAYYTGQPIQMAANGVPTPATGTLTTSSAGVLGIIVGVRYVDPVLKYSVNAQYLPSGAITAGYTDVWIQVNDDPDQLFIIQANAVIGTKTNGARGAVGQNVALDAVTSGSSVTGLSSMTAKCDSNWGSCANTGTLALRIVDIATPDDTYPELIVKWNAGVHSYNYSTGV